MKAEKHFYKTALKDWAVTKVDKSSFSDKIKQAKVIKADQTITVHVQRVSIIMNRRVLIELDENPDKPLATFDTVEGVTYRLPGELNGWAIGVVGSAMSGAKLFPCKVEFGPRFDGTGMYVKFLEL